MLAMIAELPQFLRLARTVTPDELAATMPKTSAGTTHSGQPSTCDMALSVAASAVRCSVDALSGASSTSVAVAVPWSSSAIRAAAGHRLCPQLCCAVGVSPPHSR